MAENLSPQFGSDEYHRQVAAGVHPPAMFATADELVRTHNLWDAQTTRRNKQTVLEKKFLNDPELTRNIQNNGYNWDHRDWSGVRGIPIQYSTSSLYPVIRDGHHRTAAMYYTRNQDWVPLAHMGVYEKDAYDQNPDHWSMELPKTRQKDAVGMPYETKELNESTKASLLRALKEKEKNG